MAVKIKLKRLGKIHAPQYRIVIADSRTARNGRSIEEIGIYQPMDNPSIIKIDSDRVQYWLGVGAQPTEAVAAILKVTGDWQKFKGLPGAEGTLRFAEPKPNKIIAFEAAVQAAAKEPKSTPKPKLDKAVEAVVVAEVAEAIAEEAAVEAVVAEVVAEEALAAAAAAEVAAEEAVAEAIEAEVVAEEAAVIAEVAEEVAVEAVAEAVEEAQA
ncbi:MAG: 30S ribosomal protein S16 [Actinobacteria bacterium]|nr:30S ribosomal protein S16 [Actinomycetota bacterium]